jgi:hypothetical protein
MKKLLLSIVLLSIGLPMIAQHRLEKLWESDSLTLKGPESALFDAKSKSLYISSMNSGSVVQMDLKALFHADETIWICHFTKREEYLRLGIVAGEQT